MSTKKTPKNAKNFHCYICDFTCCKESDYDRHLLTRKHNLSTKSTEKPPKNAEFACDECGKKYKERSGLWRHKRKCTSIENTIVVKNDNADYKSLFYQAMDEMKEQRHEFISQLHVQQEEMKKQQDMMGQMIDKVGTTNNNTMNNQFNINMFLNEECKNAINFSDFIDRIVISHDDLENNAELGFVNGMTKILMDNLKLLTVHERPIHCTDVKRETLYVKDENVWDKKHSNEKLENAIQEVSRKSLKSLIDWKKTNPDYDDMDSEFSKKSIYIQQNSSGICKKDSLYPKIIHNLAKENTISQLKN
jgi:hypothetical protein